MNQLRPLVVLEPGRNLSKAAQKLFMSQLAVIRVLAKLRRRSYNPLFIKHAQVWSLPLYSEVCSLIYKGLSLIDIFSENM
ncbi:LysR family transcriptional regulator [Vibrio cyclitrophicus]